MSARTTKTLLRRWPVWCWFGLSAAITLTISCQSPRPGSSTAVSAVSVATPVMTEMERRQTKWIPDRSGESREDDAPARSLLTGGRALPGQRSTPESTAAVTARHASAPLQRSDVVVAAKIARKEAKLAGTYDNPKNPHDRAKEWYDIMAGPDGVFDFQEILDAKEHADRMPVLAVDPEQRDGGLWQWEWIGPGNIGGRIRSIVIHPTDTDTMWIGGVSGGIWRTEDGGGFWYPINDFLPTLAIGCMAMHPSDPNIMFAGTGEYDGSANFMPGAGIFKSTDGGWNWRQIPDTANWRYVTRISVSPTWSQNVLAATNVGVYRSTDTGETWSLVTDIPQVEFMDVKFHPNNGSRAVAGRAGSGEVYYTTNGGINWSPSTFLSPPAEAVLTQATTPDGDGEPDTIYVDSTAGFSLWDQADIGTGGNVEYTSIDEHVDSGTQLIVHDLQNAHAVGEPIISRVKGRVELAWAAGEPAIVYASMNVGRGTIWGSDDGGAHFQFLSNTSADYLKTQGGYDNTIWVSPVNYMDVVVGGIDLWRSNDGGVTLSKISRWQDYHTGHSAHADHHYILEHPNFDGVTNKTVFFANDGGIQKATDVLTVNDTSGWTNLANNLGITQFYKGAASPDGQRVLGGTQDNDTLSYVGNGTSWFQAETGDGGYCAMNYADPENPVFFGEHIRLMIKRSSNGLPWHSVVTGLSDAGSGETALFIAPFVADPSNGNNLVAGGTSIWRTTDSAGWCFWGSIRDPLPDDPKCSAIDIAVGDGNIIWVGYSNGRLSFTTDAGSNWTDVDDNGVLDPLPNRFITDIAISPHDPMQVVVTFSSTAPDNVWYTGTQGAFWYDATGAGDTGLPDLQVNTVTWHPTNPSWIYVGTTLGAYASEDAGVTWNKTPAYGDHDGPCNTSVHDLFWGGDQLIAATHGRGMYRCRPLANVYVDWTAGGWQEDGSQAHPYDTVTEGVDVLGNGTDLYISTGDYDEAGVIRIETRTRVTGNGGVVIIR